MIKNIIFDLDGVLFDGCDFHANIFIDSVNSVCPELKITKIYHDTHLNGMTTKHKLKILNISEKDSKSIYDLKQELTKINLTSYIKPKTEQIQLFEKLKSLNYNLYCVSNSIRSTVETCLKRLEIYSYFSGIISNEDTKEPKPSPMPYLTGYFKWNLNANECVILEDSVHGIYSAKTSGGHVLEISKMDDVNFENIQEFVKTL